ncbi:hypothetical protein GCK72_022515 [Caenorhabditis remanei]|uniref:Uncharacterized protein n=2 Tax=Caenorhabditis remanei TaxID=31234 RepID=A0A6A5FU41_CAERE|nr:hypothetical protein GCK72_022515 [Caenorhabditis remanei]KAF1746063.1 hypothetical protein GCK72_022515 [Caenorhabditis remanei]
MRVSELEHSAGYLQTNPHSVQPWKMGYLQSHLTITTPSQTLLPSTDKVTTTYQKQYTDMTPFIKKIVKNHARVLVYYGDTDMACNFMMGQQFADQLGLRRTLKKTPWKFDRQIAGFKTVFDGLSFITIRGAEHMAPQWRVPQMYYAVQQFLLNHPL